MMTGLQRRCRESTDAVTFPVVATSTSAKILMSGSVLEEWEA